METVWSNFARLTGYPAEIFILTLFLIAGKKGWLRIAVTLFAFSLFRLAGEIVKEGAAVPRVCWQAGVKTLIACPDSFAFPSGHALGAAMLAMIVSLIHRRKFIIVMIWGLAMLIAASRIAVGVHSPVDVIGGVIMGIVSGWIVWKFYWV